MRVKTCRKRHLGGLHRQQNSAKGVGVKPDIYFPRKLAGGGDDASAQLQKMTGPGEEKKKAKGGKRFNGGGEC